VAFTLPVFPLTCNVWDGPNPPAGAPRLVTPGNLSFGRRVFPSAPNFNNFDTTAASASLLVPPGTDIRDASCGAAAGGDVIEVPAGTGRFYYAIYVDDLGKGFPNEHRVALLVKACSAVFSHFAGVDWPTPIP
jgi:hypothetical protein